MRKLICAICFIFSSLVFSQESWEQISTTIDKIEFNMNALHNSNLNLQSDNKNLKSVILDSQKSLLNLRTITKEQSNLLIAWENSWTETSQLLKIQQASLESCERNYRNLKISIPVIIVTSLAVGMLIGSKL